MEKYLYTILIFLVIAQLSYFSEVSIKNQKEGKSMEKNNLNLLEVSIIVFRFR